MFLKIKNAAKQQLERFKNDFGRSKNDLARPHQVGGCACPVREGFKFARIGPAHTYLINTDCETDFWM